MPMVSEVQATRLLLLGGTREARELAEKLANDRRWAVISSLAGRTREPEALTGQVRVGGFGGVAGLETYLAQQDIGIVVDATHPFAQAISLNARTAAEKMELPYLRLCRPPWQPGESDRWLNAANLEQAAEMVAPGCKVLLTIGRQELGPFLQRSDIRIVARMIEEPQKPVPSNAELILARPPFRVSDELALLRDKEIDVLVTKNAGGSSVEAKLEAARELGVDVIMIARPGDAPAVDAQSVDELMQLLQRHHAT
ncbi:MAG: cobalt-precorrin-6A reductase [Pseudomonadota bacterium]